MSTSELFGTFKLIREIGHGGMGNVHLTHDPESGRPIAIKIVPPHISRSEQFRERFKRECESLRRLDHPGIPRIYADGEIDGRRYLTMDFIDGQSLDRILKDHPDWCSPDTVADLIRALSEILSYAHGLGIVHRDVSPKNILISSSGDVKLVDFGIAKLVDEVTLTMTGQHFGTPSYMAPEQFGHAALDAARLSMADLWSMGAVAFHALCGRPPFEGDNITTIQKIVKPSESAPSVLDINPAVPHSLARVVDRMLQKNLRHRYPTAAAVLDALNRPEVPETYDSRGAYRLDDLVYLPHALRWAVVDEEGSLKKRKYVGVSHQGSRMSRRVCEVNPDAAPAGGSGTCPECGGRSIQDAACMSCGLIREESWDLCRPAISKAIMERKKARNRRIRKIAAWAVPVLVIGLACGYAWRRNPVLGPEGKIDPGLSQIMKSRKTHQKDADLTLDVNSARLADLVRIEGISDAVALGILAYRHNRGAFKDADEVTAFMRLLSKRHADILPHLTVSSAPAASPDAEFLSRYQRLDINTADKSALLKVPFISEGTAGAIWDHRMAHGSLKSLDDLLDAELGDGLSLRGRLQVACLDFISLGDESLDARFAQDVDAYYATRIQSVGTVSSHATGYEKDESLTLDVNTAGFSDLVQIPGVADGYALSLLAYRVRHGPYKNMAEVKILLDMGHPKSHRPILDRLKVESTTASPPDKEFRRRFRLVNLNTATFQELVDIPFVSKDEAQNVLTYRASAGKIKTLDDALKAVRGMGKEGARQKRLAWLEFITLGNQTLDRVFHRDVDRFYEELAGPHEKIDESLASIRAAMDLYDQGQYRQAADAYRRAAAINGKQGNDTGLSKSYNGLGASLREMKDYRGAMDAYRRAVAVSEKQKNAIGTSISYNGLGGVLRDLKDYRGAVDAHRKAAAISKKSENQSGISFSNNGVGIALAELKDYRGAEGAYRLAAGSVKQGDHLALSISYAGLIRTLTAQGRDDDARVYVKKLAGIDKHPVYVEHLGPAAKKYPELLKSSSVGKDDEGY